MIMMYVHIYLSRILLVLAGSKDFSSFLIICFKFSASVKRKKNRVLVHCQYQIIIFS